MTDEPGVTDDAQNVEERRTEIYELDDDVLAELRTGFSAAVEAAGPRLGDVLRRIEARMAEISPIEIMGVLAIYFLTAEAGINPEYSRPMGIFQSDVEVAQALALRRAPRANNGTAPFYSGGKDILDLLPQINGSLDLLDMGAALRKDEKVVDRAGVILSLRLRATYPRLGLRRPKAVAALGGAVFGRERLLTTHDLFDLVAGRLVKPPPAPSSQLVRLHALRELLTDVTLPGELTDRAPPRGSQRSGS